MTSSQSSASSPQAMRVSFVIPTLNSARTLRDCLRAIRAQRYPRDCVEVILADAGSSDDTRAIAAEFGVDRIVENPLRSGEAGKSAGIRASAGDLIALVDSDNVLDSPDWLQRMVRPFEDPEIVAAEPLRYTWRCDDPALTRYFAMLGMNDPLCLFLGNYDRYSMVTGRWTDLPVQSDARDGYLKLTLSQQALPTIGANGFVFRRNLLDQITWEPYFFDIDVVQQAVAAGLVHVAKVDAGIVHLYCSRLRDFARKQDRRIKDFLFFAAQRTRTYPWAQQRRTGIVWFSLATVLVLPLAAQALRGLRRKPDPAWLLHIPVCWITLLVYGLGVMRKVLGLRVEAKSREGWQKG